MPCGNWNAVRVAPQPAPAGGRQERRGTRGARGSAIAFRRVSRRLGVRLAAAAALWASGCGGPAPVTQPIQFSHNAHVENGVGCDVCHEFVEKAAFAGMPSIDTCMGCHEGALTDSPEEEKVRGYAERGEAILWQRVYRAPAHVFFSHRRHVLLGRVECAQCHGDIGSRTAPITIAEIPIRMSRCVDCHAQRGADQECNACHR